MNGILVPVEFAVNIQTTRDIKNQTIILSASVEFPEDLQRYARFNSQSILLALQKALSEVRIESEGSSVR